MGMKGVNKTIILGRLGQDPEVKYLPSGGAVANMSVATSESWTDKASGQKQERTEWHKICVFGKLADIAGQYLKKGSQVYFEGANRTRKWQDQSGQDRYTTEIVVDGFNGVMQMLDSRGEGQGGQAPQQAPQQNYQKPAQQPMQQAPTPQPQQAYQKPRQQQPAPADRHNPNNALPPSEQYNQQHPHNHQPPGQDQWDDDIPFN